MKTVKFLMAAAVALAFTACEDKDDDMEPTPTDSKMFNVTITNEFEAKPYFQSGIFNTPDGAQDPGPIGPSPMFAGNTYSFQFQAGRGHKLSLLTMFIQSNDWVLATMPSGIDLYDGSGNPIGESGPMDVTSMIGLYDAGTEMDQEPGTGADQAPRQSGANTGADDPNDEVRMVNDASLPAISDVIRVTVVYMGNHTFEAVIEATTTGSTLSTSMGDVPVPLSPGAYAIHSGENAFFTPGEMAMNGLEEIAEDGNPGVFAAYADEQTGYVSGFAPGAFAVHTSAVMGFTQAATAPDGLEELAEDANPAIWEAYLASQDGVSESGVFNTPEGASGPGPIGPGASYTFSFDASEGEYLSFASMLGNTNDIFVALMPKGIALFENGEAISGDITSDVMFWDAGTEVNEYPGAGNNQAPRQSGPNAGMEQNGEVHPIDHLSDGFDYPMISEAVSISIQSN